MEPSAKDSVRDFWDRQSCGEVYAVGDSLEQRLAEQERVRYELEPFILPFADFASAAGRRVLEVGVGMGADHLRFARARPAYLAGVDLTPRAIEFARSRLMGQRLDSDLRVADAETLPFGDAEFDVVYSWGVLHHSPDTQGAVDEVFRVLKPGGRAKIMIYHRASILGLLLWARYALLAGTPGIGLDEIYSRYLESPGTKAYSLAGARRLFSRFAGCRCDVQLSGGDLLTGAAGQRHGGAALDVLRAIWPRPILRALCRRWGLFLLVDATK
jgi:SAM-dependent methyltransferase